MVMLAKYLLTGLHGCRAKVVVITDRKDLDLQIAATFAHTRLNPARATSGKHLVELLNSDRTDIVTIINKFSTAERNEARNFTRDFFVLMDESHRSNYGLMANWMREIFPTACFIAFTGATNEVGKNTMARLGGLINK